MEERASRDPWASFQHDPRDPAVAPLRASDADRNIVHGVLTDAFADGRLDRDEYDERTAAVLQARTLGELPPLVADLIPDRPLLPAQLPLAAMSRSDLEQRAVEKWRSDRREALLGFLGTLLFFGALAIFVTPWTLIVPAFALMNLVRTLISRGEIAANEVKRLERKQAKAIESQQRKRRPGP
ncbi:MAG TPA: DUF1707 domain-containing protein [Nocardioides sp.]|uniref:DUF1707 SHOCT-like domain-containing protein n=1 Tax=uncultured Nocardioides sp. TaxID=198441 RepID=UPI000EC80C3B|nr:DUF1707 domain-containing protein [uncultured Nocardioides sp.]HCB05612.1 hypothetical protein [Nocardioides sp.]HRD60275.1 DUF1707 domain-containing protein [Nocardioides sp.]HRI96961.1 DUF1707 domain-containing protein [Nocardioides sp.]HRK46734.1 DUF1707 domain-containing protein [Nocardioides sp.]